MDHIVTESTRAAAMRALKFAEARNYTGADPYDGLLSPISAVLPARPFRQAWVQLTKRQGEGFRRAFGIRPVQMGKSLALFAMAAFELGEVELAHEIADRLLKIGHGGGPWGYEFDVQTRWAYYPAGSPNVIATAFAVRALDRLQRTNDISDRTTEWLFSLRQPGGHFAYTPMSDRLIHNGNLLAIESLLRLGAAPGDTVEALAATIEDQRPDGSWSYGAGKDLTWVDNFHTAYVLDSLRYIGTKGLVDSVIIEKGINYWLDKLFLKSGEPLYFSTSSSPSNDIHNIATAVSTLSDLRRGGISIGNRDVALRRLLTFLNPDAGFRKSPKGPLYMRWNHAHATYALTRWI